MSSIASSPVALATVLNNGNPLRYYGGAAQAGSNQPPGTGGQDPTAPYNTFVNGCTVIRNAVGDYTVNLAQPCSAIEGAPVVTIIGNFSTGPLGYDVSSPGSDGLFIRIQFYALAGGAAADPFGFSFVLYRVALALSPIVVPNVQA